jgi:hypothetical protein
MDDENLKPREAIWPRGSVRNQEGWRSQRQLWQRLLRPDRAATSDSCGVRQYEFGEQNRVREAAGWRTFPEISDSLQYSPGKPAAAKPAQLHESERTAWLAGFNPSSGPSDRDGRWREGRFGRVMAAPGSMIPFRSDGGALRFTISCVEHYQVAAVTVGRIPTASAASRSINEENWSCELPGSANVS